MVFNLPEDPSTDSATVLELLKEMPYDTSNVVIRRIGKVQTNITRPLKLTFKSVSYLKWILQNREMPSGVTCSSDKTPRQQQYY